MGSDWHKTSIHAGALGDYLQSSYKPAYGLWYRFEKVYWFLSCIGIQDHWAIMCQRSKFIWSGLETCYLFSIDWPSVVHLLPLIWMLVGVQHHKLCWRYPSVMQVICLQYSHLLIVLPLTNLVNLSFRWKKWSSKLSTNFNLSVFSKIFKKTMLSCLLTFLKSKKNLHGFQFDFQMKHSTEHACITLLNFI